jgi:predicted helicase
MTKKCEIYYFRFPNCKNKQEKLTLLDNTKFKRLDFKRIFPDKNNNWINQTDNDFESLIPVCDKQVKLGKNQQAIFKLFSLGVSTNRDDWVFDFSHDNLISKVNYFIETYTELLANSDNSWNEKIKWSEYLKGIFKKNQAIIFNENLAIELIYRPFIKQFYYSESFLSDRLTQNHFDIFGKELDKENRCIVFSDTAFRANFSSIAVNKIYDLHFAASQDGFQSLPLYIYDKDGSRHDNITDWALNQFKSHYQNEITKLDIFHYVYAVLHNPAYREKYELNLKREFPRIPFYNNFFQWADWGKQLMDLHLNYETIEKYPLKRIDLESAKIPKAKLKADKENNLIILDDNTTLSDIPAIAWDYKLGNRSALEWILDQYKEKKPKDITIAEKFNTYRFADYKEAVIDLLMRVCTVSVETLKIVDLLSLENQI